MSREEACHVPHVSSPAATRLAFIPYRRPLLLPLLGCLLLPVCAPTAGFCYWPPLQNVQAWVEQDGYNRTVRYKVYDPARSSWRESSTFYPGAWGSPENYSFWTISSLTATDGVVAWQAHNTNYMDGTGYEGNAEAGYAVYDPAVGSWQKSSAFYGAAWGSPANRSFWTISSLTATDGVVAWQAHNTNYMDGTGYEGNAEAAYAVYDPTVGSWQESSTFYQCSWGSAENRSFWIVSSLTTTNGLVAWRAHQTSYMDGTGYEGNAEAGYAVYDPAVGSWQESSTYYQCSWGSPEIRGFWIISSLSIQGEAVLSIADHTVNGQPAGSEYRTRGYDHATTSWYEGPTKPLAYFHASPTSGDPPLWVWFTDMSIGATSWNWNFGDGWGSYERSPYHTFAGAGLFSVTQLVTGPAGTHSASTTIRTDFAAPTGSITINAGAAYTNSTSVILFLSASDNSGTVSSMQLSNDGSTWSGWEAYATTKPWMLSSGDGEKTVYVQFKDAAENVSSTYSDTIILDTTAPSVTSTNPINGTPDVSPDALITASFSEAMDPATINTSTFTLMGDVSAAVAGSVSYDGGTCTATFDPAASLAPDTYTAAIAGGGGGVKDGHGLPMPGSYTWSFVVPAPHTLSVTAFAVPSTVGSGGSASLSATATDSRPGHSVASWSWDDGEAEGSFSPSATTQNPTYTAPANTTDSDIVVDLTVEATCDGPDPLIDSDSTTLTVQPVEHALEVLASADPLTVASGGTTSLTANFSDSRSAHMIAAWSWDDGGASGTFSPSGTVWNPSYTAPENTGETDLLVTLTVTGICNGPGMLSDSDLVNLTVQPVRTYPAPGVVLELHPNERAPGATTNQYLGKPPWTQPTSSPAGSYWWKKYEFAAHGPLWIQVCAQNWDKTQKGYADHDDTKLYVNGAAPTDYDLIQSGAPGTWQWTGGMESGKRVTLRFLVPCTPGKQVLWIGADESPALWWLKVIDLEPGVIEAF